MTSKTTPYTTASGLKIGSRYEKPYKMTSHDEAIQAALLNKKPQAEDRCDTALKYLAAFTAGMAFVCFLIFVGTYFGVAK